MRRADQLQRTMTALRCCLDDCRRAADPLGALARILGELRLSPDLTDADIAQIEQTVRRALAACPPAGLVADDCRSANLASARR